MEAAADSGVASREMTNLSPSRAAVAGSKAGGCKDDKACSVCGDRALGYNFDAITCESCKAFFRRNAIKGKAIKCMFNEDCKLNANTRRFCSACRLHKCFAVGMKKEMILDEEERKRRTEKVISNRAKKLTKLQQQQRATAGGVVGGVVSSQTRTGHYTNADTTSSLNDNLEPAGDSNTCRHRVDGPYASLSQSDSMEGSSTDELSENQFVRDCLAGGEAGGQSAGEGVSSNSGASLLDELLFSTVSPQVFEYDGSMSRVDVRHIPVEEKTLIATLEHVYASTFG